MHDRTLDISPPSLQPARRGNNAGTDMWEALADSTTPAFATDAAGHVVFWNRAIEKLFDRPRKEALGRHCFDLIAGRDVFGNRFCHESCVVRCMSRRGEAIRGFEMVVGPTPRTEQPVHVSILEVPDVGAEDRLLIHLLDPVDQTARLTRALERLGPTHTPVRPDGSRIRESGPASPAACPLLTKRENEVLEGAAAGLQNKEVAQKLGISVATARNHIHNILEKLDVHSKLEAVSLAFRQGWVTDRKAPAKAEGDHSPRA